MIYSYTEFINNLITENNDQEIINENKSWNGYKIVKRLKGKPEEIVARRYFDDKESAEKSLRKYFKGIKNRYGLTDKGITGILNKNIAEKMDKGKAFFVSGYLVYPLSNKD